MLAFLQYLIAFLIARDGLPFESGETDVWGIVALTAIYWAAAIGFAWVAARRPEADQGPAAHAILRGMAGLLRLAGLFVFYGIAQGLGGRFLAEVAGIEETVLLPDLLRLAPFLALSLANRTAVTVAAQQLGLEVPTRARMVIDEVLAAALPLGPILLLVSLYDVLRLMDPTSPVGSALAVVFSSPVLQVVFSVSVIALALAAAPFGVRLLVRAHPLPAGPLRDRLEAYGRRVGFGTRDILVWPTTEALNAAVIGALPRLRYVVLTQGLLDALEADEIEAVYAHEAGHGRRGHVLLFFGFTAALPLALLFPQLMPAPVAALLDTIPSLVRVVLMLVLWIGVVFGWFSRRFEEEADVFGLETLAPGHPLAEGEQHPFARALERIAEQAPEVREVTGWRHYSIAHRVGFVRAYLADEAVRLGHRRALRTLRVALLTLIGGLVVATALALPRDLARVSERYATLRDPEVRLLTALAALRDVTDGRRRAALLSAAASAATEAGRDAQALRWAREAVASAPRDAEILAFYARALDGAGRPQGARRAWERVAALPGAPDALREEARSRTRDGR